MLFRSREKGRYFEEAPGDGPVATQLFVHLSVHLLVRQQERVAVFRMSGHTVAENGAEQR